MGLLYMRLATSALALLRQAEETEQSSTAGRGRQQPGVRCQAAGFGRACAHLIIINNSDAGHPSESGFRRQACNRVKTSFSAMRPPPGWGCQSCCFGYGAPPPGGCPGGPGPVGRSSSIGMPFASRGRRSSRLRLLISLSIQWTECECRVPTYWTLSVLPVWAPVAAGCDSARWGVLRSAKAPVGAFQGNVVACAILQPAPTPPPPTTHQQRDRVVVYACLSYAQPTTHSPPAAQK